MLSRCVVLSTILVCSLAGGPAPTAESQRVERVASLGKLWGRIRLLDPDLATKAIDWDQALVAALKSVNEAKSSDDYAMAATVMLQALGDPTTGLVTPKPLSLVELPDDIKPITWLDEQTLLLHLNDLLRFQKGLVDGASFHALMKRETGKARRIIFDLRPEKRVSGLPDGERSYPALMLTSLMDGLTPNFIAQPLTLPSKRFRIHRGYRGEGSGDLYYSGIIMQGGVTVPPAASNSVKKLAFLINDRTILPLHIMALHEAGLALVVMEGGQRRNWAVQTSPFALPEGIAGQFKTADWVFEDGSSECIPDILVPASSRIDKAAPGVSAILRGWANKSATKRQKPLSRVRIPRFTPDAPYSDQPFPAREYRALAAIKFWCTIDSLYPYKNLMDRPWDSALPEFLELMDRAKDVLSYQLNVATMVARLQDSHGRIENALRPRSERPGHPEALKQFFGSGNAPVALAMIDGHPVVVKTWVETPTRAGFQPGDEILSVDGELAQARMDRVRPFISASTPQRLEWLAATYILRGPLGKSGLIEIRRANGQKESVTFIWSTEAPPASGKWRNGPEFKVLPGNIGYVDLDRIASSQVDQMFEALKNTQSLVLDMRGYPTYGAWQTVGLFLKHPEATGYLVRTPLVLGEPDDDRQRSDSAEGSIRYAKPARYTGRVVMLMDETSQSAAEYMGMVVDVGAEGTIIGSPTSGANGDVTPIVLPGALRVLFTGANISHADGRQLQRVGIQPQILVRPTSKGLSDGHDEVLERALTFLNTGK